MFALFIFSLLQIIILVILFPNHLRRPVHVVCSLRDFGFQGGSPIEFQPNWAKELPLFCQMSFTVKNSKILQVP